MGTTIGNENTRRMIDERWTIMTIIVIGRRRSQSLVGVTTVSVGRRSRSMTNRRRNTRNLTSRAGIGTRTIMTTNDRRRVKNAIGKKTEIVTPSGHDRRRRKERFQTAGTHGTKRGTITSRGAGGGTWMAMIDATEGTLVF